MFCFRLAMFSATVRENRAARAIIESGELGELVMIDDHSTGEYFTPERPAWFMTKKLAGGGVSINFGVHTLDRFCYLTGSNLYPSICKRL